MMAFCFIWKIHFFYQNQQFHTDFFFFYLDLFFSSVSFHVKNCGKQLICQANKKEAKMLPLYSIL